MSSNLIENMEETHNAMMGAIHHEMFCTRRYSELPIIERRQELDVARIDLYLAELAWADARKLYLDSVAREQAFIAEIAANMAVTK